MTTSDVLLIAIWFLLLQDTM